jgi:hypothetical protein
MVMPVAFAMIPVLTYSLYAHHHPAHGFAIGLLHLARWEWLFALLAAMTANASVLIGFLRHRQVLPIYAAIAGAALLIGATVFPFVQHDPWLHAFMTAGGGLGLVMAHVLNLRANRRAGLSSGEAKVS